MYEDFQYIALLVELLVNVGGLALGVILIFRAHDNHLMRTWGVYTIAIMLLLINSNYELIRDYFQVEVYRRVYMLSIDMVMITFGITTLAAIFPIMSLRPGWLNNRRRILMGLPILISFFVVLCFLWFDGTSTPLHQTSDIFEHIDRPDVQMRVVIFCLSILTTLVFLAIPFFNRWIKSLRRASRGMYFYCGATLLMLVLYTLNTMGNSEFVFYTYGYSLVLLPIVVSIFFLYSENPLSRPVADSQIESNTKTPVTIGEVMSPELLKVYEQMDQYMQSEKPYVEANYQISHLANDLGVGQNLIIRAIRERGFSGYTEYLNFWRIEHFKDLASKFPGLSIKELMFGSGFTSRSSFYRRFAQKENMSPKEYIERKL